MKKRRLRYYALLVILSVIISYNFKLAIPGDDIIEQTQEMIKEVRI